MMSVHQFVAVLIVTYIINSNIIYLAKQAYPYILLDQIVQPYNTYLILFDSVCTCGILKFKLTIKIVIPSIASFVERSGFVHLVFSCLLFGGQHLQLTLCLFQLKRPKSFYYICWKFLQLCWHYALCFSAPIMLKFMLA